MKSIVIFTAVLLAVTAWAQPNCDFPYDGVDMGDLMRCNYPTLVNNPGHGLSGIAWLGEAVDAEPRPDLFNQDTADDGVDFIDSLWWPCQVEEVLVTVTAGPNYDRYVECNGLLYLNAWKDGNIDGDFCDELCGATVSEWMIQDLLVTPGAWRIPVIDPGVYDLDIYDGAFRFRLTSQPVGRFGFGAIDTTICPECVCGGFIGFDFLGEVEDYYVTDLQQAVELADYRAIGETSAVRIVWATASEAGNDFFSLYRDDTEIVRIPTLGNGPEGHVYSYTDRNVSSGMTYNYRLIAVDLSGEHTILGEVNGTPHSGNALVMDYALHQNYPNPFNPGTSIRFDMPVAGHVTLVVYNPIGQEVATLANGNMSAGSHIAYFNGSDLPSGLYFGRLTVNGFTAEKKMLLLK